MRPWRRPGEPGASGSSRTAATGPLGILGGTFDPVHNGHLRAAIEVLEACRLAGMRLIPAGSRRTARRRSRRRELRLRMLRAAVAGDTRLAVDDREMRRRGPSYMVDTLASLRTEVGQRPLSLVLGADAFLGLADLAPVAGPVRPRPPHRDSSARLAADGGGRAGPACSPGAATTTSPR